MPEEKQTLGTQLDKAINLLQNEDFQKVEFETANNLFISAYWSANNQIRINITAKGE